MFLATIALQQCTTERDALMALYNNMGGDEWINSTNWDTIASVCSWYGVTCNQGGFVIELNLANNDLVGQLPSDIECLPFLKSLIVNNNTMSSTIPEALCNLTNLQYFEANGAGFTGTIPTCICTMTNIMYFYIENNLLTGSIPECVGSMTFLREMHLDCNSLSGTVPLGFTQLQYLTELRLQCNTDLNCESPLSTRPNFVYVCGDINCDLCTITPVQCPTFLTIPDCGNYFRRL